MLLLPLFLLIVIILNNVSGYSSYIAIAMQILAAFFITKSISYDEFKIKYINIISSLAGVSLICYLITLVYPSFMLNFPLTQGNSSVDYYNAGIHVFQAAKGFGYFVPESRNAGIFWEPGAYQAFLNMGLALLLTTDNVKTKERKAFFLILATITTGSTTGYLILFLLCIVYRKQLLAMIVGNNKIITLLGLLVSVVFFIYISASSANTYSGVQKLINEFTSGHFLERLYLDDLRIILQSPLNFLGISFETYEEMGLRSGNSIVYILVTLGIPFTAILMKMYFNYAQLFRKSMVILLIFVFMFSTESLLWRPFFLCLAWYGSESNLGKKPATLRQRNSSSGRLLP